MMKICCHVQTLQNLKLKLSVVTITTTTTATRTTTKQIELLLAQSHNLVNHESKFFPAQRSSHNDYSIFININLYINIVQINNIGYWCFWKQYQKAGNKFSNKWLDVTFRKEVCNIMAFIFALKKKFSSYFRKLPSALTEHCALKCDDANLKSSLNLGNWTKN